MDGDPDPCPTTPPLDKADQIVRDRNTLQGLCENKFTGMETEDILLTVMPEIRRSPEGRIDVDGWQITRKCLERGEFSAQVKVNADLGDPLRVNGRINSELSLVQIAKKVRLGEDQAASHSQEHLRTDPS